jgi:hypothetical protein
MTMSRSSVREGKVDTHVYLPASLHRKLVLAAKRNGRSVTKEVEMRVKESLAVKQK